jgi:hypothetical protein
MHCCIRRVNIIKLGEQQQDNRLFLFFTFNEWISSKMGCHSEDILKNSGRLEAFYFSYILMISLCLLAVA